MEYTAEDYTFWGQVGPQIFWLVVIVIVLLVYAFIDSTREGQRQRKQVSDLKERNDEILSKRAEARKIVDENPSSLN